MFWLKWLKKNFKTCNNSFELFGFARNLVNASNDLPKLVASLSCENEKKILRKKNENENEKLSFNRLRRDTNKKMSEPKRHQNQQLKTFVS